MERARTVEHELRQSHASLPVTTWNCLIRSPASARCGRRRRPPCRPFSPHCAPRTAIVTPSPMNSSLDNLSISSPGAGAQRCRPPGARRVRSQPVGLQAPDVANGLARRCGTCPPAVPGQAFPGQRLGGSLRRRADARARDRRPPSWTDAPGQPPRRGHRPGRSRRPAHPYCQAFLDEFPRPAPRWAAGLAQPPRLFTAALLNQ